jgi:hypothetical protein
MTTIGDRRRAFRALHTQGCFVIPNPWDIGTARYLQHLGFKALATTSAGFAFSRGLPDNAVPRDLMLAHIREVVGATDVPVNADFEGGYAHEPEGVAESVRLCVETGVAGLSIEDSTGDRATPLYDLDRAVARIRAARAAIDRTGGDVLLTGRAECFLVGRPDLEAALGRELSGGAEEPAPGCPRQRAPHADPAHPETGGVLHGEADRPAHEEVDRFRRRCLHHGLDLLARADARRVQTVGPGGRIGLEPADRLVDAFADAAPHPEVNGFFRQDLGQRTSV